MYIGVMVDLCDEVEARFAMVEQYGLSSCQLCNWRMDLYTDEMVERVRAALSKHKLTISSLWAGWSGPKVWNLVEGPLTLGFLPQAYQSQRVEDMKRASDFAKKLGITQVATHAGFIPENPNESGYAPMIVALKEVARYLKQNGQKLLFETGQESPVTLLRAFEDIGTDNLGVNLDPANLILYGKANPVDAVGIIGKYVCDVHGKDGTYPTCGRELGEETALGQGNVDYPALIRRLKEVGYDGAITIEREISGEQQVKDIIMARDFLKTLI